MGDVLISKNGKGASTRSMPETETKKWTGEIVQEVMYLICMKQTLVLSLVPRS